MRKEVPWGYRLTFRERLRELRWRIWEFVTDLPWRVAFYAGMTIVVALMLSIWTLPKVLRPAKTTIARYTPHGETVLWLGRAAFVSQVVFAGALIGLLPFWKSAGAAASVFWCCTISYFYLMARVGSPRS